ncbi:hypothetical protein D3C72_2035460 [compost metagenome]
MPAYSGNGSVVKGVTFTSGAAATGGATSRLDNSMVVATQRAFFMASLQVGLVEPERLV